ncbi:hypothetical protein [Pseudolysinimonas yzui]|uniref:Uncharacterized protein n=1 Tax=Pseudolysinimonas yzui TaxID=2708254 RepID=A0A8J3GPR9_9MICO|nr:hypothetical protein [Pseudolysinimonas yzui]GHF12439.1 hypothetical protein GCM10011600_11510 [Pseudolysinimonas yzui]
MKIDVRTPDGKTVTAKQATLPLGSALRIVPAFTATAVADDIPVETKISASYSPNAGRYRITSTAHKAVGEAAEITPTVLRQVRLGELLSAAVPYCVAITDDEIGHGTVRELLGASGRLLPEWMSTTAAKAGPTGETLELVQVIYGIAALSAQAPMRAVATELSIPERTATHWITKARNAGLLDGITYAVGRQPDGRRRAN